MQIIKDFNDYLFRASGVGHVTPMTGEITQTQLKTIDQLQEKKNNPLTEEEIKKLDELLLKKGEDTAKSLGVPKETAFNRQDEARLTELLFLVKLDEAQTKERDELRQKKETAKSQTPAKEVVNPLNKTEQKKLETLQKKKSQPITEKQEETLLELIAKRDNPIPLSDGAITFVDHCFITAVTGRRRIIHGKQISKGNDQEETSIDLISQLDKKLYLKNEEHFSNEWVKGTPDVLPANEDLVIDIKTSWDIFTFYGAQLSPLYEWQLRAYMWLTGRKKASLRYCLVNASAEMIADEIEKLKWSHKQNTESESYKNDLEQLMKNLTFDDIPAEMRVKTFDFEHDDAKIEILKERISLARERMNNKLKTNSIY